MDRYLVAKLCVDLTAMGVRISECLEHLPMVLLRQYTHIFKALLACLWEEEVDDRDIHSGRNGEDCRRLTDKSYCMYLWPGLPKKNLQPTLFSAIGPATRMIICAANWLNMPTAVP